MQSLSADLAVHGCRDSAAQEIGPAASRSARPAKSPRSPSSRPPKWTGSNSTSETAKRFRNSGCCKRSMNWMRSATSGIPRAKRSRKQGVGAGVRPAYENHLPVWIATQDFGQQRVEVGMKLVDRLRADVKRCCLAQAEARRPASGFLQLRAVVVKGQRRKPHQSLGCSAPPRLPARSGRWRQNSPSCPCRSSRGAPRSYTAPAPAARRPACNSTGPCLGRSKTDVEMPRRR